MRFVHTLLIIILVCMPFAGTHASEGKLMADCIIQLKGVNGGQTRVTVMPGNAPAYVLTPSKLHFILDLPLNETYLLTFEHPGCVTKQLYVNAAVPPDRHAEDFDFPLQVTLEHHEDPFSYAGPVGFIYYEGDIADFSFHTDYAMVVDKRFEERMAELERTGIDPHAALLSANTTTTPAPEPREAAPRDTTPVPAWGTVAPTVAHVPPMVHRLTRPEDLPQQPEAPAGPQMAAVPRSTIPRIAPEEPEPVPPPTPATSRIDAAPDNTFTPVRVEPIITRHAIELPYQTCTWDLIVEERRVTTIIRFKDQADRNTEYRRVQHISGAAYYFENGRSISARNYDRDTRFIRQMADTLISDPCNIPH